MAIAMILVINSVSFIKDNNPKVFVKHNIYLAKFSYSLYLFHYPFMVFLISVFHYYGVKVLLGQPIFENIVFYLFLLVVIYSYSYTAFFLFERHTGKIKNILFKYYEVK